MNNLLRTLAEIQAKSPAPESDLQLLLSTVKEARRQCLDTKVADAFYDSLEGLLHDLRTVTIDNRDAEAFLKPVSKVDVPDYYDVITTPMDLQTMLKKVKQKVYKSKKEFKDDLDLIWSNCFMYNATENHPLRQCAKRLRAKADRLLKYITDRKDRVEPAIPGDFPTRGVATKVNGTTLNGISRPRSIQPSKSPSPVKLAVPQDKQIRRDVPFPESSAILRTPFGMSNFLQFDRELDARLAGPPIEIYDGLTTNLEERLKSYTVEEDGDSDDTGAEVSLKTIEGEVGEKRKLNGYVDNRPRKRARTSPESEKDVVELWWDAMRSESMIGNGLPALRYPSSDPEPSSSRSANPHRNRIGRPKGKKKKQRGSEQSPNTLLYHMNNNIRTLRKVRTTHAKFAALKETNEDGTTTFQPPELPPPPLEDVDDVFDEKPWRPQGLGIEIGEQNGDDCLHWMGSKVLEHVGFQGTSKIALDVLAGVTSDYLLNVGRTIRFLVDKYATKMTPEEIILHTLFESGTTRIVELDRYIKDDVIRYGSRLVDLEKKLSNAYSEATTVEAWDDDALFRAEDDEEEEGQFVMGNFADSFGEDFLGLRELGIAAEFGLSSLSIPKKLLKGKGKGDLKQGQSAAKPSEPPPPFPPPPPFVPLDSKKVEDQIGLLQPYYHQRIAALSATIPQPPAIPFMSGMIPGMSLTPFGMPPLAPPPFAPPIEPPTIILPDDAPTPVHTKIGPIGQIIKSVPSASASKKKSKAKVPTLPQNDLLPVGAEPSLDGAAMSPETPMTTPRLGSESPRKNKGAVNGMGKKKAKAVDPLPPVIMAGA